MDADVKQEVKRLSKGRTKNQIKAIKYFYHYKKWFLSRLMSDRDYENMVMRVVKSTDWKKRALSKIGIDESDIQEVRPIHFEGYDFSAPNSLSYCGKDLKWRSSHYQISWLFCSDTQLYVWQYTFSTIDNFKQEKTKEYFYKDINIISTSTETVEKEVPIKRTLRGKIKYGLQRIDTQQFSIVVSGDKMDCLMEDRDNTLEASIQGLKTKLREKKNQYDV